MADIPLNISDPIHLPKSTSNLWINFTGLFSVLFTTYWIALSDITYNLQALVILIGTFAPIILMDIFYRKVHQSTQTGLNWDQPKAFGWQRVAAKLTGAGITAAILAAIYWVIPEYSDPFHQPGWDVASAMLLGVN